MAIVRTFIDCPGEHPGNAFANCRTRGNIDVLDIALVNFVGAGLTTFAPIYSLSVPQGAMHSGVELFRTLNQLAPKRACEVMENTARNIWSGWLDAGLPNSVAIAHLDKLPDILDANRPDPDHLVAAMAVATAKTQLAQSALEAQARRLSTDIIERARQNNSLAANGLSDSVCFFFLETMYLQLLLEKTFIDSSHIAMDRFFSACSIASDSERAFIEGAEIGSTMPLTSVAATSTPLSVSHPEPTSADTVLITPLPIEVSHEAAELPEPQSVQIATPAPNAMETADQLIEPSTAAIEAVYNRLVACTC